jgi:hypothetical protein
VRVKASYRKAKDFCLTRGMQLYQIRSSSASTAIIKSFTKKFFGASAKAVGFIDGYNGKECMTFSGVGKTNYDSCKTSYTFFCEFNDKGTIDCFKKYLVSFVKNLAIFIETIKSETAFVSFLPTDAISQDEKDLEADFNSFIETAMNGGDASALKKKQLDKFVELAAIADSTDLVDKAGIFLTSLTSLLSSLKQNPTEVEKAVIKQKFEEFTKNTYASVFVLPGLEDASKDSSLKSLPENREILQLVQGTQMLSKAIIADPAIAYKYVSTEKTSVSTKLAHYVIVLADILKRYRNSKLKKFHKLQFSTIF